MLERKSGIIQASKMKRKAVYNWMMILKRNTWNPEIAASQFLKRKDGCVMEHAP